MKKSDFWKGKHIKAEDLAEPVTLTIETVKAETLKFNGREERKPVVYFERAQKSLPLNMTNFDALVELTGADNTDEWPGHRVEVYATTTEMNGETKPCVRLREPAQGELKLAA